MGQVKFATKLRRGIFGVVTLAVLFTIVGLSFGLFLHTESHIKQNLILVTGDIIRDKLRISDGEIRQKEADDGHTLGVELRAKDLSAIIVDKDGQILARYGIYRDIEGDELEISKSEMKYEDRDIKGYGLFDTYTVPIKSGDDIFGYMRIIRKNNEVQIIKDTIGLVILFVLPISWLFAYFFSYVLVKRITRPLRRLVKHLENVEPASMNTILDSPSMDHEVRVVTRSINGLIERLKNNLKRERQITENISHEFKTPLTRIASNLQVGKAKEAETEILELGGNVDALLSLAIWEKNDERCDLVTVIKHLAKIVPKNLKVELQLPKKIIVPLPYSHAIVIWRNILDNAIKHNRNNGYIVIKGLVKNTLSAQAGNWEISVSNSTLSAIKATKKVTERKYRSGVSAGHGIGMSIVADMCKLHDLRLEVSEVEGEVSVLISG